MEKSVECGQLQQALEEILEMARARGCWSFYDIEQRAREGLVQQVNTQLRAK